MLAESAGPDAVLFDLRRERNWAALEQGPLQEALKALKGTRSGLLLDFADGARWRLLAGQGWRFWRRPLAGLPA